MFIKPLPKHSKQVLLEFSGVLKLPEPAHLEQITLKQGIEFLVRILVLKVIFESSIFNFEIREFIPGNYYKIKHLFLDA